MYSSTFMCRSFIEHLLLQASIQDMSPGTKDTLTGWEGERYLPSGERVRFVQATV